MSGQWDELLRQDHEITERVFAAMEARFASAAGPSPAQVMTTSTAATTRRRSSTCSRASSGAACRATPARWR